MSTTRVTGNVRQSISLPSSTAQKVRALAKRRKTSTSRILVELIEAGLAVKDQEKKRFFDLCERLQSTEDPEEREELKRTLAKLMFGD